MKIIGVISLALLVYLPLSIAEDGQNGDPAEFSTVVDAVIDPQCLRASLATEEAEVMVGAHAVMIYRVSNIGNRHLIVFVSGDFRNRLGRSERFEVVITNDAGKPLALRDGGFQAGGMYGPKDIPSMGHHTERLVLGDWRS